MSKVNTYFGFKNGKLISILQSVNSDIKEAIDCTYYIANPQEVEKQIQNWKKINSKKESYNLIEWEFKYQTSP